MNIAFDLDGVLVDVRDYAEKYLIDEKDWKSYFARTLQFSPIEPMVELVCTFIRAQGDHVIYFVTGRPESNRELTEVWLKTYLFKHTPRCNGVLLMRENGDMRSTAEVKLDLLRDFKVDLMFDDDPDVVEKMLKEGYTVVQVHGFRYNRADLIPPK